MEEARATESRVRMGDARRPFDIRPTVFIIGFSVLLASALIVVNTRSSADSVDTAALRALDEGAERVGARQIGAQSASRQIVSPAVTPESMPLADGVVIDVAGESVNADAPDAEASANATAEGDAANPATTVVPAAAVTDAPAPAPATTNRARVVTTTTASSRTTTTTRPATTTTRRATTTTRPAATTTTTAVVNGRYSVGQVIDGTIGAGDGSNPNEESPMGRHDAPLYLPQTWNWAQGPTRN